MTKSVITAASLLSTIRPSEMSRAAKIMTFFDEQRAWHSEKSDVYHIRHDCENGNNIEPENYRVGTGGKRRCSRCNTLRLSSLLSAPSLTHKRPVFQ